MGANQTKGNRTAPAIFTGTISGSGKYTSTTTPPPD